MEKCNVCPCPNIKCPNHGNCKDCTSRHLKINSLNYCGFYSILPTLEEAIELSPESPAALKLSALIKKQTQAYTKLIEINSLSENNQQKLRVEKSRLSKH